ncbi:iron-sulfur cluster-binding protein [Thiohalocapsa marina]|uniref:Iron-sulfur cluster-binding protein n=1 Tax=Thiohalocapsa marina TaxID=424902 RepID=A0A5M8FLV2_9GAMM|nr:LutB/LldF family L-lactate oxidation iron-sulfur protein [Thiohalocapsa marina]KAA6181892.1 iron-sulfur cluster-binding protein [Thiohalocapsa marina]
MASAFRTRAGLALSRERVRGNIRRAMDGLVAKRRAAFPDDAELAQLRDQGQAIRDHALANLPALLEQLEQRCRVNGMQVHWAADAAQANAIILDLLRGHGAKAVIKGKSMVSEEIGVNAYLERHGIEPIETDLGELILQLGNEHPSHIITPAVHKDRAEIAALFNRHFPDEPCSDDIDQLTALARRVMRARFQGATVGMSGVNFAVAETGTLCLVENEGNGRLSTTAPDMHIAVTGIEKVVARLDALAPLLTLLTRSATGQPVTTYVNMISGPRKPDERDGPREVHLVLLDNGRSRIHADPELRATLRCIRCGACMNHCPVYTRIGGHGYGTVYPGPIGAILEPQLQGLQVQGELAQASSLCGACAEVCPVRIPIPQLLNRLRHEHAEGPTASQSPSQSASPASSQSVPIQAVPGGHRPGLQGRVWRAWALLHASPARYRWMRRTIGGMGGLLDGPFGGLLGGLFGPWTRSRTPPRLARRGLQDLARQEGFADD